MPHLTNCKERERERERKSNSENGKITSPTKVILIKNLQSFVANKVCGKFASLARYFNSPRDVNVNVNPLVEQI